MSFEKFLFTADIHIKLGQKHVPVEWARNRYRLLFKELVRVYHEYDAKFICIGGDLFDRVPTLEELELYGELLNIFKENLIEGFIIPGNHEALKKNTTFLEHLKSFHTPRFQIVHDYDSFRGVDIIPYNRLKEFEKKRNFIQQNRILITHVRGDIPPHVKSEVDLEIFEDWDLVLAGDLHSHSNSQRNIVYPGSPLTTSFHRNKTESGVLIVDSGNLEWEFVKLKLPQLLTKTIKAGEPTPPGDYDHIVYEVEGDALQIAALQDNTLIGKKITKRVYESALILSNEMDLRTEVSEYLRYILELPEDTIDKILGVFDSHEHTS